MRSLQLVHTSCELSKDVAPELGVVLACAGQSTSDAGFVQVHKDETAVYLTYHHEEQACLSAKASGGLCLSYADGSYDQVEDLEEGLAAAAWSSNQKLLAVVTCPGSLLLMNEAWDTQAETSIFAAMGTVVPGRELSQEQHPAELQLTPDDVHLTWRGDAKYFASCSRAQAGSPFVVRIWEAEACKLHAVGEAAPGLLGPIAWQPNGRHLYAAQQTVPSTRVNPETQKSAPRARLRAAKSGEAADGRADQDQDGHTSLQRVVLFERNGLLHGGLDVASSGPILDLQWSADSTLLAVTLPTKLALWQRSNWHWYRKWELAWPHAEPWPVRWDCSAARRLHLASPGWLHQVDFSPAAYTSPLGTAAVVDGSQILITPLRHTVIPPPMAAAVIHTSEPGLEAPGVACMAIRAARADLPEAVAAVTSAGLLAVAFSRQADLWEETALEEDDSEPGGSAGPNEMDICEDAAPVMRACSAPLPAAAKLLLIRALSWTSVTSLLLLGQHLLTGEDQLIELSLEAQQETRQLHLQHLQQVPCGPGLPQQISHVLTHPSHGAFLVEASGTLWAWQSGSGSCRQLHRGKLPKHCTQAVLAPADAPDAAGQPVLGLTQVGELWWGSFHVASSITSMTVRHEGPGGSHLLFTTQANSLITVPFQGLREAASSRSEGGSTGPAKPAAQAAAARLGRSADEALTGAAWGPGACRAVEQGALLVAAPAGGSMVVLQMPRGNLEAIYPRVLTQAALSAQLEAGRFAEAWECATVNRMDLSLIAAHGWPRFLSSAAAFVAAVPKDQDLVDFLTSLQPHDTRSGLMLQLQDSEQAAVETAVQQVCQVMRSALQSSPQQSYLRPLLTSHMLLGEHEAALQLIKQRKEQELAENGSRDTDGPVEVTAEDGMRHVLLTIPAPALYRAALGMYDFEVAFMVVAHSQLDPGECQLELQSLAQASSEPLRRHAVDMHLQRWPQALAHVLAAGEQHFPAALALAEDKGLLRELLRDVGERQPQRNRVLSTLGSSLASRGRHEDAAVAHLAAGDVEAAALQYQAAGAWQMALALAGRAGMSAESTADMAEDLVEDLEAMGRLPEAATLARDYLKDAERAVLLLIRAREWRQAMLCAYQTGQSQLVDSAIQPAAEDAASSAQAEAEADIGRIHKYLARLKEVHQKRIAMAAAVGEPEGYPELDDGMSTVSTAVTGLSAYTLRTHNPTASSASQGATSTVGGRGPGQHKGKKGKKIKQGAAQEEAALHQHVSQLAPSQAHLLQIGQLGELLILFGHFEAAGALQAALSRLQAISADACAWLLAHPVQEVQVVQQQGRKQSTSEVQWKWHVLKEL